MPKPASNAIAVTDQVEYRGLVNIVRTTSRRRSSRNCENVVPLSSKQHLNVARRDALTLRNPFEIERDVLNQVGFDCFESCGADAT
jgi:hypothetical protein